MVTIPKSLIELSTFFSDKGYEINTTPIDTDYIIEDQLFVRSKKLAKDISRVWHLVNDEDLFHIWLVESKNWKLKSWRKQVARNFQFKDFADKLVFYVPESSKNEWDKYSLIVITDEGLHPVDMIVPNKDTREVCQNVDSNNKYYVNFDNKWHFLPFFNMPDDKDVKDTIKKFLQNNTVESSNLYTFNTNCEEI